MSVPLLLEALDYLGPGRWRWVLSSGNGRRLARHEVRLDTDGWEYEALTDLPKYLSWHTAPDRWEADEERILTRLGAWIGDHVLGPVAAEIVRHKPATVQITVSSRYKEERRLLFLPLELASVRGRPLTMSRISFVRETAPAHETPRPRTDRLRILGLFSLPEGRQPLNLRRERQALVETVDRVAAMGGEAEIRVLQYGATRDMLRKVLAEPGGWDIVHIAGHGDPGELLLEKEDGTPDPVSAPRLADLLSKASRRPRLVMLSACWSAAPVIAEQRLRGQASPADLPLGSDPTLSRGDTGSGALAADLSERLECPVVAMRYPVADEFATEFCAGFYGRLLHSERPLPEVLSLVVHELGGRRRDPATSALSTFSPVLFGGGAAGLTLRVPERSRGGLMYDAAELKMADFPPPPSRFVGRTGIMARASADLAPASGVPGVLLHGMPGAGKTACALELAHTHEHAFDRLVWFQAPDEGRDDWRAALANFALVMERQLPGLKMVHEVTSPVGLGAFLPRLTDLFERRRILLILDNIESLLTDSCAWRDEGWGKVIAALCDHAGVGRVVLTSRRLPQDVPRLRVEALDALSPSESFLLALELPRLRALIRGDLPDLDRDTARQLALGVLATAHGHPKLLEFADSLADDSSRLETLVRAGDRAWESADSPHGISFASSEAQTSVAGYLRMLEAWTRSVSDTLAPGDRTLLWFLCCLEENDRKHPVVADNWACFWHRLGRPDTPPDLAESLRILSDHGLMAVVPESAASAESYAIHPTVAAASNAQSGDLFRDAVDQEIAAYWMKVMSYAASRESEEGMSTLVARAGLAAVPHLIRLGQWRTATAAVEEAFNRDRSAATAAAVLPLISGIVDTGTEPRAVFVLAQVLEVTDPPRAELAMRACYDKSLARGDIGEASLAAGYLSDYCLDTGRLAEAMQLADESGQRARQAGLGPWTQLACAGRRLQVLNAMGRSSDVLSAVQEIRAHMADLPDHPAHAEAVIPWNIRETLLDTGRNSAVQLGRWDEALELGHAITDSKRARGARSAEIARTRFNDYYPLIILGRLDEALALLLDCRGVMQDAHDIRGLGRVLSALADVEDARNHGESAIALERDALRYKYLVDDVLSIAISYNNLGGYLRRHARQPMAALSHHLAASLISDLAGAGSTDTALHGAAAAVGELDPGTAVPADLTELCAVVADVPGTDFEELVDKLCPDRAWSARKLRELASRCTELAASLPRSTDPALSAMVGTAGASAFLIRSPKDPDLSPLAMVLGRILSGELDRADPVHGDDLAVAAAIVATLRAHIPASERPASDATI